MKRIVWLLLIGILAAQPVKEAQWAAQLRAAAATKHLHWRIFCTSMDAADEAYLAEATFVNSPLDAVYIEEGAVPHWSTFGRTQEIAARNLLVLIKGSPNDFPGHSPQQKQSKCKSEIRGGDPGQETYVTECKDCGVKR